MRRVASILNVVLLVLFAGVALAEKISNWAAPSTWTPPAAGTTAKTGVKTGLVTVYPPLPFIPLAPCRLADTRSGSGFSGQWGPPSIAGGGTQRTFTITGQCGIPSGASAVSFNFAVWGPPTRGDLRVFPAGGGTPLVSTLNWEAGILALANAAVVPLGAGGAITLQVDGAGTVDIFFDVNGYYSQNISNSSGGELYLSSNGSYTIFASNSFNSGTAIEGWASGTGNSWGVYGHSSGAGYGVFGENSSAGPGVFGFGTGTGVGVQGISNSGGIAGVSGVNNTSADNSQGVGGYAGGAAKVFGVQGEISASATAGAAGVHGIGGATTGKTYGLVAESYATASQSAGVFGKDTIRPVVGTPGPSLQAGVRGEGGNGVVGITSTGGGNGVTGVATNGSGTVLGYGIVGISTGTNYSFYGISGDIGCAGCAKSFVEAHPQDASKTIHYVAIEGPEAGTYFRGTAATVNGSAVIVVPDHFRWVTSEEGMTVQLTTVGGPAQVWVEQQGLDQILVRSNRDVRFHYLVQGVRQAFRDFQVIRDGTEFLPQSPEGKMQPGWTEFTKSNLVSNGTYNPDGTINMRTAERLGWAQKWREEERLQRQAVSRAPQEPGQAPRQ